MQSLINLLSLLNSFAPFGKCDFNLHTKATKELSLHLLKTRITPDSIQFLLYVLFVTSMEEEGEEKEEELSVAD